MGYDYDDSTVGEGILAWILMNLGLIPLFIYIFYLHTNKGRSWGTWGYLGKTAGITFLILFVLEFIVGLIIFFSVTGKYLY